MYSFYYSCTFKKVTMITSTHSLPLHFIVLKIRKVLHFLLSRMNKVDHDFFNHDFLANFITCLPPEKPCDKIIVFILSIPELLIDLYSCHTPSLQPLKD